jgi:hypothetical protein
LWKYAERFRTLATSLTLRGPGPAGQRLWSRGVAPRRSTLPRSMLPGKAATAASHCCWRRPTERGRGTLGGPGGAVQRWLRHGSPVSGEVVTPTVQKRGHPALTPKPAPFEAVGQPGREGEEPPEGGSTQYEPRGGAGKSGRQDSNLRPLVPQERRQRHALNRIRKEAPRDDPADP